MDRLEELQAYSKGWMDITQADPTNVKALEAEAARFGVAPVQYRFRNENVSELKKVYMGLALVYGDKQESLPAITQVDTLEYELSRAIRSLLSDGPKPVIGLSTGHGEPDIIGGGGPLATLSSRLSETHDLRSVSLAGDQGVPDDVDALWVVGPQKTLSALALYHLDQFLMRGGALGIFATNTRADMRAMVPQNVYHGMDGFLGHFGVLLRRDLIVDRVRNGLMGFPVRQGRTVREVQLNYPLIPKATELDGDTPVLRGIDALLAPFVSSLELADPLPPGVQSEVWARTSPASGRIQGIRTIDPQAYQVLSPGEETGSWPFLVALSGRWSSYFTGKDAPPPSQPGSHAAPRLRESAPARLVAAGSADFVANNIPFMLNLADWMVQDEALIGIRAKNIGVPELRPIPEDRKGLLKLANLLGGVLFVLVAGLLRKAWLLGRSKRIGEAG